MTGDSDPGNPHDGLLFGAYRPWVIAFPFLLVTSTSALANAGTPLMWAGMLHLVFGNLVIGLGEGQCLCIGSTHQDNYQDWYWVRGRVDLDTSQGVARFYRDGAVPQGTRLRLLLVSF